MKELFYRFLYCGTIVLIHTLWRIIISAVLSIILYGIFSLFVCLKITPDWIEATESILFMLIINYYLTEGKNHKTRWPYFFSVNAAIVIIVVFSLITSIENITKAAIAAILIVTSWTGFDLINRDSTTGP